MKNQILRRINIIEEKIKMLEEFSNEMSHYISKIEQEFETYKLIMAENIEKATDYISERLDKGEKDSSVK